MNNVEKGNQLRDFRKRLDYTQHQMADALGLDSTYLSQLENGRRDVDEWYLRKAEELLATFEQTRKASEVPVWKIQGIRGKCHLYLDKVLDACNSDEDRLAWTCVELQRHFPLASSGADAAAEELLSGPAPAAGSERRPKGRPAPSRAASK
jgi:transcriptional regulator with XRE-family HTH domain